MNSTVLGAAIRILIILLPFQAGHLEPRAVASRILTVLSLPGLTNLCSLAVLISLVMGKSVYFCSVNCHQTQNVVKIR